MLEEVCGYGRCAEEVAEPYSRSFSAGVRGDAAPADTGSVSEKLVFLRRGRALWSVLPGGLPGAECGMGLTTSWCAASPPYRRAVPMRRDDVSSCRCRAISSPMVPVGTQVVQGLALLYSCKM